MKPNRLSCLLLGVSLLAACGGGAAPAGDARSWQSVKNLDQNWRNAPKSEAAKARQRWIDALREFVVAHPNQEQARNEWDKVALEFARDLERQGRYRAAAPYLEAILEHRPDDDTVSAELAQVRQRMTVSDATLKDIHPGMTRDEVEDLLGPPRPGWSTTARNGEHSAEAWFYEHEDGGKASIHFVDGKVFQVDVEQ